MAESPADWYPDPYGRHEFRYYDGASWTDHVSSNGRQSFDPIDAAQIKQVQGGVAPDKVAQQVEKHFDNADKRGAMADRGAGMVAGGGLLDQQIFVVNQKAKLIEVNSEYAIYSRDGGQIGAVRQVGQSTLKKVARFVGSVDQFMTHHLQVVDAGNNVVLTLTRPRKFVKSRVIVSDGAGNEIGEVVQNNVFGKISFGLMAGGNQVGSINAENWRAWNFNIQDHTGAEVARITKTFEGVLKTAFTTADNYVVEVHRPLADPLRQLVVASALSVDTALKQDSRGFQLMGNSQYFHPPHHEVVDAVRRALAEDLSPLGDMTSGMLDPGVTATAQINARKPGRLAGCACAAEAFRQADPSIEVTWHADDGDRLEAGTVIADVSGSLATILVAERTALNFLGHLSGIATRVASFVDLVDGRIGIWDTRKTTPGLRSLEKAATRAGGGRNHRGNLSGWLMFKDNHLVGMTIGEAVAEARDRWPGRPIHVECDRLDQVEQAVAAHADCILLDNMSPETVTEAMALIGPKRADGRPIVEASGGITIETVESYADTGIDFVSSGSLTNSAPVLDIGLDIEIDAVER